MNLLFWNVKNKGLDDCLVELTMEKNCDLIVLAEYPKEIGRLCNRVNVLSKNNYMPVTNLGGCNKIKAFMKSGYPIHILREQSRYQILMIKTSLYKLIIAMMHNISKLYAVEDEQEENLRQLHRDLEELEAQYNTHNVLVMGDLNVNPFEKSCIAANSIHGIPYVRELTEKGRIVQGRVYKEFYNPMWKFLGARVAPFGTYFYNNSKIVNYFWNTYDQFLVRPQLVRALDEDSLEIVTHTASFNFMNQKGKPDQKLYSDHLPIFVKLKEELIL